MDFPSPLMRATLVKRYKRFLADVVTEEGEALTVHCPNTGAMLGLTDPGTPIGLSTAPQPHRRRYGHTWEVALIPNEKIHGERLWVGTNPMNPNRLIRAALIQKQIPYLQAYTHIKPEVRYGDRSRIDFLLTGEGQPPCYVEVKNVHLNEGCVALFPDSVTERGARHMAELERVAQEGAKAVVIYVVQRADCDHMRLASSIDPNYAAAAEKAFQAGVVPLPYQCTVNLTGVALDAILPFG